MNQKNRRVIEEFRANGGVVNVTPPRGPVLILHSKGAKTGRECVTPLMYLQDGDRYVIFASRGGSPRNPDWYHNLVANPDAMIEVGTETFAAIAALVEGEERDLLFKRQATAFPQFAYYQAKTRRRIPVIALVRAIDSPPQTVICRFHHVAGSSTKAQESAVFVPGRRPPGSPLR